MLLKPGVDTYIDDRPSCTKEEAVAKLIGWMQGKIRRPLIAMDAFGALVPEQLVYLDKIDGTVLEMLYDQHSAALAALRFAEESQAGDRTIDSLRKTVGEYEKQRVDAARYSEELEVEIAKGAASELELDLEAMDETGVLHITLDSLEKWAYNKYHISISVLSDIQFEAVRQTEEQGQLLHRDLVEKGWLTPVKAEHLHLTLALAIVALAHERSVYRTTDGKVSVANIVTELLAIAEKATSKEETEEAATKAAKTKQAIEEGFLPGQGARSLTTRIDYALRSLRVRLPGKLRNI